MISRSADKQEYTVYFRKTEKTDPNVRVGELITPIISVTVPESERRKHQTALVEKLTPVLDLSKEEAETYIKELESRHQKQKPIKTVRYGARLISRINTEEPERSSNTLVLFVESNHTAKEILEDSLSYIKKIIPRKNIKR